VGASLATLVIPAGFAMDSTKLSISGNTTTASGDAVGRWLQNSASANSGTWAITCPGTTTTILYSAGSGSPLVPVNASVGFANSVVSQVSFKIPIAGWQP